MSQLLTPVDHGGWWDGAHHASLFFIYLTTWTQVLTVANSSLAAALALEHVLRVKRGQRERERERERERGEKKEGSRLI